MRKLGVFIIVLLGLQSCEDTVDLDLDTEEPRLVIEATGLQNGRDSTGQFRVKLSETAPYFQDSIPKVSDAEISLEVGDDIIDIPESTENPGLYKHQIPMVYDEEYKLSIKVDGETYQGKTHLHGTAPMDGVEQGGGIFDSDEVLLKVFYTDPADEENYYLFSYRSKHGKDLMVSDDEHYNGNQTSSLYNEEFNPGDSIRIQINGTGEDFNRYISTLLDQSNPTNNPFATAPTTVRGNIVNVANSEEFPLGYFRISQEYNTTYVVQ